MKGLLTHRRTRYFTLAISLFGPKTQVYREILALLGVDHKRARMLPVTSHVMFPPRSIKSEQSVDIE